MARFLQNVGGWNYLGPRMKVDFSREDLHLPFLRWVLPIQADVTDYWDFQTTGPNCGDWFLGDVFLSVSSANIQLVNLFLVPLCGGLRPVYWADVGSPGTVRFQGPAETWGWPFSSCSPFFYFILWLPLNLPFVPAQWCIYLKRYKTFSLLSVFIRSVFFLGIWSIALLEPKFHKSSCFSYCDCFMLYKAIYSIGNCIMLLVGLSYSQTNWTVISTTREEFWILF